jgi:hypothetical protein
MSGMSLVRNSQCRVDIATPEHLTTTSLLGIPSTLLIFQNNSCSVFMGRLKTSTPQTRRTRWWKFKQRTRYSLPSWQRCYVERKKDLTTWFTSWSLRISPRSSKTTLPWPRRFLTLFQVTSSLSNIPVISVLKISFISYLSCEFYVKVNAKLFIWHWKLSSSIIYISKILEIEYTVVWLVVRVQAFRPHLPYHICYIVVLKVFKYIFNTTMSQITRVYPE